MRRFPASGVPDSRRVAEILSPGLYPAAGQVEQSVGQEEQDEIHETGKV